MEVATNLNVILNFVTAGLVAYTARKLKLLRDDLRKEAAQVRRELNEHRADS